MTYKHERYTTAIKKAAKLLDDPNLKGPAQIELERLLVKLGELSEKTPLISIDDYTAQIKSLDEAALAEKQWVVDLAYGGIERANQGGNILTDKYVKAGLVDRDINPDTAAYRVAQEFTGKILNALGSGRGAGK
ncbi:MAG: hypothetical protein SFW63_08775 [Alphaproteobacteria bacterium]|nr:hypothetical protein [Alphaproteobacteria bacterium]